MKKLLCYLLSMCLIVVLFGCTNTTNIGNSMSNNDIQEVEITTDSAEKIYRIGIGQFAEHPSLDNCRIGIIEGLKEYGFIEGKNLEIKYDNAETDGSFANQIYNNYKNNNMDLVFAIATPMAQSAYSIFRDTNTPVIFSAVTDPIAANIANDDKSPVGNITGTSDKLPVEAQLDLIRKMYPDAKRVGILYTTSEINSISSIKEYESIAPKYEFEIVTQGINETSDLPMAVDSILSKDGGVDVITNLTDNTVVASLPVLLQKANEKKVPVFGSEIEQVKNGCIASMGLEYVELGRQTGRIAAQILKGEKFAASTNYELIENSSLYINLKTAEELGYEFSEELINSAEEKFN